MGTIYRKLVYKIDKLQEIVKENGLKESYFNELSEIKNAIPANEINRRKLLRFWKKVFSSDKTIQPDNIGLFLESVQRYVRVQHSVCDDLNMRILALECNDIAENEEMISFLVNLEERIHYPEKYIDFNDILSLLDLSDDREILKQYIDALGNTLTNYERRQHSERTIYERLLHQEDRILDYIGQEIQNQQTYYKDKFDSLTEIENKYKKMLVEKHRDFIGQIVSDKLLEFSNSTIIGQWNQMYGQEAGFYEPVKQEEMYVPFKNGEINIQVPPVFPVQNSEWMKYSETYIGCIENNLRKEWERYIKDYVKRCVAVCLKQEEEAIVQKKKELVATGEGLKQKLASWRELLLTISSEQDSWSEELQKLYMKATDTVSKSSSLTKKTKSGRAIKKSVITVISVMIVIGIVYNVKRNSHLFAGNIEDQKIIKNTEDIMSETESQTLIETLSETSPETLPETSPEIPAESSPETLPETSSETLPKISSETLPETTPETSSEIPAESSSKAVAKTPPGTKTKSLEERLEESKKKNETKVNDTKKEEKPLYILPEISSRYLSEKDLDGLNKKTLRLARNEVFARHGRLFQTEDLNEYFSKQSWYHGYLAEDEFDDSVLNTYEKYNLDLIKSIECRIIEVGNRTEKQMYILPDSNSRYLSAEDLKGLDERVLRLARNEIFARHGRLFETEDLNRYFSSQSWYHGHILADQFNDSVLNEYEHYNLELIKSLEKPQDKKETQYENFDIDWYAEYQKTELQAEKLYKTVSTQADDTDSMKKEYKIWDNLLNELYTYLKEYYTTYLDGQFEVIREEERNWMKEKEERAEQARDSAYEYKENAYYDSLIQSTKARIVELIEKYVPAG